MAAAKAQSSATDSKGPTFADAPLTNLKIELPGTGGNDEAFGGCRTIESAYEFNAQLDQIGEGTYGQVYLAKERNSKHRVALKKIRMDTEKEGFPITAIREIRILSTLDHPNVIKLREIVRSQVHKCNNYKGSIYMVFDFMDHDLTGLQDRHGGPFKLADVKCYLNQLLQGLHFCHSNGVLHRDLKASNLLISNEGILKLADFGLARLRQDNDARLTNRVITLWYRPPELLLGADKYGPEVDMWSVGCIFAELLTGKPLFPGKDEADQLDKIFQALGTPNESVWPGVEKLEHFKLMAQSKYRVNVRDTWKQKRIPEAAIELLQRMLTLDPKKRIPAEEALRHDFFFNDPKPTEPAQLQKFKPSHEWTMKKQKRERQQGQYDHSHDSKRQKYNLPPGNQHGRTHPPQGQQRPYNPAGRGYDLRPPAPYGGTNRAVPPNPYGGAPPAGSFPHPAPVAGAGAAPHGAHWQYPPGGTYPAGGAPPQGTGYGHQAHAPGYAPGYGKPPSAAGYQGSRDPKLHHGAPGVQGQGQWQPRGSSGPGRR